MDRLLGQMVEKLAGLREQPVSEASGAELPILRPREVRPLPRVLRRGRTYMVEFRPAERLAAMVDQEDGAAMSQLMDQFRRRGVVAALENAGIRPGDRARVGAAEWEWE